MNKKRLNDCYKCLSKLFEYGSSKEKEAIATIKNMINGELENLTKHNNDFKKPCPNTESHYRYDESKGECCPICKYAMKTGRAIPKS